MSTGVAAIEAALIERLGGSDALASMRRAVSLLLRETGNSKPPTKLSDIVRFLGAKIEYDASVGLGSEEAALKTSDNGIVLWVSRAKFENKKTRTRARFSIAHEVAHLMLYKILGPEFLDISEKNTTTYRFVERLCDATASHLLIPRSHLAEAVRQYGITSFGISHTERIFEVSNTALLKAIADLTKDGTILEWRFFQRTAHEDCTWRIWQSHTGNWTGAGSSWMPTGSTFRHISGVAIPDDYDFDRPLQLRNVTIIRGRSWIEKDAIACKWPARNENKMFEFPIANTKHDSTIKVDRSKGRFMIFVGAQNRMDFSQFGLEVSE